MRMWFGAQATLFDSTPTLEPPIIDITSIINPSVRREYFLNLLCYFTSNSNDFFGCLFSIFLICDKI